LHCIYVLYCHCDISLFASIHRNGDPLKTGASDTPRLENGPPSHVARNGRTSRPTNHEKAGQNLGKFKIKSFCTSLCTIK